MYNLPSLKRRKVKPDELNLVPILDAVFILIFFLLMSAQFVKLYEVGSELPIRSESSVDDSKETLSLLVKVNKESLRIYTGKKEILKKTILRDIDKKLDLLQLRKFLINVKKDFMNEDVVTFEPGVSISYQEIIEIIDQFKSYKKNNSEVEIPLFKEVVFGNLEGS